MYTEICAELGEAIAAVSRAPYIQFHLIFEVSSLECVFQKRLFTTEAWVPISCCLLAPPYPYPVSSTEVPPKDYFVVGFLSSELTFTSMPKENVLRTLYTLRLYPALKSSERVRL